MADCSELGKLISEMSQNAAAHPGVKSIDDVVKVLSKDIPGIKRADIVESLTLSAQRDAAKVKKLSVTLGSILKNEARSDKTLRAQAKRLKKHIDDGTFPEKKTRKAAPAEIQSLRRERDKLKEAIKFNNPAIRERLKKQIDVIEKHLKDGTLPQPQTRAQVIVPEDIQALRNIRGALRRKINASEPAVQKRLEKQIAELSARIDSGIELPANKAETRVFQKKVERLQFERDQLRRKIDAEIRAMRPKTVFEHIAEPFNAARSIMTSMDLSAVLRQGGFIALGNPARALKNFPDMFKAFGSEQQAFKILENIKKRPNAPLYARSKLYLAEIDGSLAKKEEEFMTKWAEKVPLVKGSGRAYVTFLNKLRADTFDTMSATLSKNGNPTIDEVKAISNFINVATGRGNLGQFEQASLLLNTAFFAPKYAASRFQLLVGQPLFRGTANTRKLIAKEYAKFVIGIGSIHALASFSDDIEIEWDARSSDFGKLKIGNTRIDPLAGLAQVTVLLSRLAAGGIKSPASGNVSALTGDVPFGRSTTTSTIGRFLRGKLSPMFGKILDVREGKNVVGEEVTPVNAVTDLVIPLSFRDIGDAIEEQGLSKGVALGLLSIFGAGLQTYKQESRTKITFNDAALSEEMNRVSEETGMVIHQPSNLEVDQFSDDEYNEFITRSNVEVEDDLLKLLKKNKYINPRFPKNPSATLKLQLKKNPALKNNPPDFARSLLWKKTVSDARRDIKARFKRELKKEDKKAGKPARY